jgi:hypothetical protein
LPSAARTTSQSAQKVYAIKFYSTYQTLYTMTNPAAETKSIGLLADAQLSWFLNHHLDNFIVTGQLLPTYRDSTIWTVPSGRKNLRPSTGTLQKHMPTLTQTATPHTTGPLAQIQQRFINWPPAVIY